MKVYNQKSDKPMTELLQKVIDDIRRQKGFNAQEYVEKKAQLKKKHK